jgi:hypothetical protein
MQVQCSQAFSLAPYQNAASSIMVLSIWKYLKIILDKTKFIWIGFPQTKPRFKDMLRALLAEDIFVYRQKKPHYQ